MKIIRRRRIKYTALEWVLLAAIYIFIGLTLIDILFPAGG